MEKADSTSIMSISIWGFKLDLQNKQMHESAILKVQQRFLSLACMLADVRASDRVQLTWSIC